MSDKIKGTVFGAAIGDAYGFPFEKAGSEINDSKEQFFCAWQRKAGGRYWPYLAKYESGTYSDDTQLLIAQLRAMLCTDLFDEFAFYELPEWLGYEIGGGAAIKAAAKSFAKREFPWDKNGAKYFQAGGNGAIMHSEPLVVFSGDKENYKELLFSMSAVTHGHPRAILGTMLYGAFLKMIYENSVDSLDNAIDVLIGQFDFWGTLPHNTVGFSIDKWLSCAPYDYSEEWRKNAVLLRERLERLKDSYSLSDTELLENIGCYSSEKGAGDNSALAAISFFFRYRHNIVGAAQAVGSCVGIDTDTVASVLCGAIGLDDGYEKIKPIAVQVRDHDYICCLCEDVCTGNTNSRVIAKSKDIKSQLKSVHEGGYAYSGVLGKVVVEREENATVFLDSISCRILHCVTDSGQHILLKYFKKETPSTKKA